MSIESIQVGAHLPRIELSEGPDKKHNIADLCADKKVVIFAVPGAFTPGCSYTHLPGYIEQAENIKAKGVELILCISVNDPFVMEAWGKAHHADGRVTMLADTNGEFTKAVGLTVMAAGLGGLRSKRYSMLVENGIVTQLNVEPNGFGLTCSLAQNIVEQL